MSTYAEDEASAQKSRPEEGYTISYTNVTFRLASADHDVVIDGNTYRASPIRRSEIKVSNITGESEVLVSFPVLHFIPQRYIKNGVPPRQVSVTITRKQRLSGQSEQIWSGLATSMAIEGHLAILRVPARSSEAVQRRIPTVTVSKTCPHILYDEMCRVVRSPFQVSTTVLSVAGNVVRVVSDGSNPDPYFRFGELLHIASGERMTIMDHTGDVVFNTMTLQASIFELKVGDAVQIFAGCDHTIFTCRTKFNNQKNFGGLPQLPDYNMFIANGYGIYGPG